MSFSNDVQHIQVTKGHPKTIQIILLLLMESLLAHLFITCYHFIYFHLHSLCKEIKFVSFDKLHQRFYFLLITYTKQINVEMIINVISIIYSHLVFFLADGGGRAG